MDEYIGLDVSLKETAISIRRDGKRVWRGKCASDPQLLAALIRKRAPAARLVVFETGPLSVWFFHALRAEGVPAVCIDARHAKAALDMAANKTDADDADGLVHLAEVGFYKEVRVKSFDSMLARTLVAARTRLVRIGTKLSNQIRGLMKTFGLVVPPITGGKFKRAIEALLADHGDLGRIIRPLIEAWRAIRLRTAELSRKLLADARQSDACQLLMSTPGVGVVTATSFIAAIEEPANLKRSRFVGAWVGLTTRRYQSGEVDYDGHISRRGDRHLRGLLYEAATSLLTRSQAQTDLRTWGLRLRERLGFKRAAVAVARKRAVIMHTMLTTGEPFRAAQATAWPTSSPASQGANETSCRDVGRSIPLRTLHRAPQGGRVRRKHWKGRPRSSIMRRHMPTAKTTMLPATASQKYLAASAIRRRTLTIFAGSWHA